jgi:chemotaxis protein CheX
MTSANDSLAAEGVHAIWIPLLEMATREVFELMLGCQLAVPETAQETDAEVTAMVGLAGAMCGVLSVRCTGKAAALMASKMLGVEIDKVGADMPDALGEVCNMVAGNFKNKITSLADGCMLSPPTVITGKDYRMHCHADSATLQITLLFESMPIVISLQIQS